MENETIEFNTQPQQMAPQQQMPEQEPQLMGQSSVQIKYAGFWIRWVANMIDGIVLIIPQLIVGLIVNFATYGIIKSIASNIVSLLITWTYFVLMTNKCQATLGKKVFGIRVISDKSENLTLGQIILRETIGKLLSIITLFVGYIMVGFTKRKQGLHDKIASTAVVYNDPSKKFSGWAIFAIILACILPFIAILGILASIVLVSLQSARTKAQDAGIKATIQGVIPDALIYTDTNSTYKGYKIKAGSSPIVCSGEPIVNISADGKQMAIFMKSCKDTKKYFCGNPETGLVTETAEVDEVYVKSGATSCAKDSSVEITVNTNDGAIQSKEDNQLALSSTFKDDNLGYEIKYPSDWGSVREDDKEAGVETMFFAPKADAPSIMISINKFKNDVDIDSDSIDIFIKSLKDEILEAKGKSFETNDFSYKLSDGTILNGKQFESEYEDEAGKVKQSIIAIAKAKDLFWMTYVSDINKYDEQKQIAEAMLDSWKIK